MLTNGCSASGMAFMKQTWTVRPESKGPQFCLLREAVHPIRRHYTLSDRVHRDVTGASRAWIDLGVGGDGPAHLARPCSIGVPYHW